MSKSGFIQEIIVVASDPTEKYPPLPSRDSHFPKQPELPSQQQLFVLGLNQLLDNKMKICYIENQCIFKSVYVV